MYVWDWLKSLLFFTLYIVFARFSILVFRTHVEWRWSIVIRSNRWISSNAQRSANKCFRARKISTEPRYCRKLVRREVWARSGHPFRKYSLKRRDIFYRFLHCTFHFFWLYKHWNWPLSISDRADRIWWLVYSSWFSWPN